MNAIYAVIATVFVVGVLSVVAYAFYKMSPYARHPDHFRDPETHKREEESPHLETWQEFDKREHNPA